MNRSATALISICGSGVLVFAACGPQWTSVGSDEAGGFVIAMPGATLCAGAGAELSTGRLVGRACSVEVTGALPVRSYADYSVSWFDLPAGLQGRDLGTVLRENASRLMHEGQQISQHRAALGGSGGLEFQISPSANELRREGPAAIRRRLRECVHKARLYQVSVVYYQLSDSGGADPGGASEQPWIRMVDSFHFGLPGEGVRKISLRSGAGRLPRTVPRPPWATGPAFSPPTPTTKSQRQD